MTVWNVRIFFFHAACCLTCRAATPVFTLVILSSSESQSLLAVRATSWLKFYFCIRLVLCYYKENPEMQIISEYALYFYVSALFTLLVPEITLNRNKQEWLLTRDWQQVTAPPIVTSGILFPTVGKASIEKKKNVKAFSGALLATCQTLSFITHLATLRRQETPIATFATLVTTCATYHSKGLFATLKFHRSFTKTSLISQKMMQEQGKKKSCVPNRS